MDGGDTALGQEYSQKHTVTVTASDGEEETDTPYSYSGIAKIMYELKQGEQLVYAGEKMGPFATDWDSLAQTRELTDSLIGLQKGKCGNIQWKRTGWFL